MLRLPNVTLLSIDVTEKVGRTLLAMQHSTRLVDFGDVILVTDTKRNQILKPPPRNVRIIHRGQSDERVEIAHQVHSLPIDYERDVLILASEIIRTDYVLYHEWDAAVLNPLAWNKEFLHYDFIGAPWVAHHDPGWPPCDGETNAVGNGGFCLKSRRFCDRIREARELWKNDFQIHVSDSFACRTARPWMEKHGVRYAPVDVASRFSCENRIYSGQFGFHGRLTATMNGWDGDFFGPMHL